MTNPLLEAEILPSFTKITPNDIKPAIEKIIDESRTKIKSLLRDNKKHTWRSLQEPLDRLSERLSQAWSPVSHLNHVANTPALRKEHDACLMQLSEFNTWLGQNHALYNAYQQLAESSDYDKLDEAQKKIITDSLRDFRLAGVALSDDEKKRFADIQRRLSQLTSQFFGHILDATMAWTKEINDLSELEGVPDNTLALMRQQAQAKGKEGYLLTLDFPNYYPVITYCKNRALREEVYRAYTTRASDQGPQAGQFDNSAIMDEIVTLRQELAALLDFNNYSEFSLVTKMSSSPTEVMEFLNDLAAKSRPQAKQEYQELKLFAENELHGAKLQAWDVAYFSEKLQQQRYSISQEELRPWFPVDKALHGLFTVVQRLYGLSFTLNNEVDTWHPDVRFYNVERAGKVIGQFYIDLYAREHKRDGAWMDGCRNRWKTEANLQIPVAYLTCNFTPPVGDKPALLTHDEVVTLFHEFGHTLHHILTEIDYPDVSGINGVPWDAVELPSQFMENWCWEQESIALISGHYETGEPLPEKKLKQLLAAKNFQSGMFVIRQIEFALFDMRLHSEFKQGSSIQQLLDEVRTQVAVMIPPSFNRFQHSFSHIFDGGYAAGYYSYLWAEVLSADAYSAFEEEGIFNAETGKRFLETILSKGGARDPMDMFVAFRGRRPSINALLRHKGIGS